MTVETWRCHGLRIGADSMLRVQGYGARGRPPRPVIVAAAEQAAIRASELAAPEARFVRVPIVLCSGASLVLSGGYTFSCPVFGQILAGCDEAIVFLLTLGPDLEAEVASCYAGSEALDAFFLDSAGWLLVEQASRQLRADLSRRLAAEGQATTVRLGPGYDYRDRDGEARARWNLDQQQELFRVFGDAVLPVTLLDSSAMVPRMSRSGLYGVHRT
jgi:hypothetical protein